MEEKAFNLVVINLFCIQLAFCCSRILMNTAKFVRTYRFSSWVYVCTLLAEGMLGLLICGADPPCALAVWLGCRKVSFTFEFEMLEQRRVALRGRVSVSRLRSSGCY